MATVLLLWCMGLKKNQSVSTLNDLFSHCGAWDLCNSIATQPLPKNKYFCFCLQYYYGAWDLKKLNQYSSPPKINIFVSCYSTAVMVQGTQKKLNRYSTLTEKNISLNDVLPRKRWWGPCPSHGTRSHFFLLGYILG